MKALVCLVLFFLLMTALLNSWQTALLLLLAAIFIGLMGSLIVYSWHYMKKKENDGFDENP